MRSPLPRRLGAYCFSVFFSLAGCDCDPEADAGGDGGLQDGAMLDGDVADAADASIDAGDRCLGVTCGSGQQCQSGLCTGTCDGVTCAVERVCRVENNVGVCVAACDPACGEGQRCEVAFDNTGSCVDNSCTDLGCGPTEACVPAEVGTGFVCVDNSCTDDLDCDPAQFCDGSICVSDACTPGVQRCDGNQVRECQPNGALEIDGVQCGGASGFSSQCTEVAGEARCSCRDDWDCPAFTECVVDRCEGSGRTPSCFLPPLPFGSVLPTFEPGFPWGGDDSDGVNPGAPGPGSSRLAEGSPFPRHAQVSTTPLVVNLDDDNGDGLIDERDFPEIVFTAFCDENYFDNGVLRAVHGGGAAPGSTYFAVCDGVLWQEGDPLTDGTGALLPAADCGCDAGNLEPTGSVAAGDLDGDGVPEILVSSEGGNSRLLIYDNTGQLISDNSGVPAGSNNPAISIANVDGAGFAEAVVGHDVYLFTHNVAGSLVVDRVLEGQSSAGINNSQGPSSCVADLTGDGRMEIVAGAAAYRVPLAPAAPCPPDPSTLTGDERAYCEGELLTLWDQGRDGFCAIADVLPAPPTGGAPEDLPDLDHPLDGVPEVLLISDGELFIYDGAGGTQRLARTLDNRDGGAPNVDDFDGDGFPEVGTAFDTFYTVVDLQPTTAACPAWTATLDGLPNSPDPINTAGGNVARVPPALGCVTDADCGDSQFSCSGEGQCVCLHNGWESRTQDASSRVTGSSVFDFNGDGRAEVVYNDECFFRIYDGANGEVYQRLPSQSPTRIEYPVVADVDNDGNAEVVYSGSNARSEGCPDEGTGLYFNGIGVLGEPTDRWVSARRMWNQHSYHVTNVLEGGGIPLREPDSWGAYNGRPYNTYRSNLPPGGNVAPDLVVDGVRVRSPDVACGEALTNMIRITARVANQGDLRVGPGVVVRFFDGTTVLGEQTLSTSLEPGAELFVSLDYSAPSTAALPSEVRVVVDAAGDPAFGTERECDESNNSLTAPVDAGVDLADLRIELTQFGSACPGRTAELTVFNDGAAAIDGTTLRVYAGDPAAGGEILLDGVAVGPIAAGASLSGIAITVPVPARLVTLFFLVDPDNTIEECDDGNNQETRVANCGLI